MRQFNALKNEEKRLGKMTISTRKIILFYIAGFLFCTTSLLAQTAQTTKRYIKVPIAFYNVENLFDTEDGPNEDEDFLPHGSNAWTPERYALKLKNMASVIAQIGGNGPTVIGLAEVENRRVLEDLVAQPSLKHLRYSIVHYDSPDARGIDCALLFRPEIFRLTSSAPHQVDIPNEPNIKTRDVLQASGYIDGELFHILVAHWPSRSGGEAASLNRRMAAALTMRRVADSLLAINADSHVVMMGDFNDDPSSPSVAKGLGLGAEVTNLSPTDFFSPMLKPYKDGIGTLAYRDVWNLFDIIGVNGNLLGKDYKTFRLYQDPKTGYYGFVFNKKFLRQQEGRFRGYPKRTIVGGQYQGGYSDHFPVYIYVVKEALAEPISN